MIRVGDIYSDNLQYFGEDIEKMNDVKSQDELNKPETHSTEVLLEVISKLETTTKQLRIATLCLSRITNYAPACFRTEECPLEDGDGFDNGCFRCGYATAWEALNKIKELEK